MILCHIVSGRRWCSAGHVGLASYWYIQEHIPAGWAGLVSVSIQSCCHCPRGKLYIHQNLFHFMTQCFKNYFIHELLKHIKFASSVNSRLSVELAHPRLKRHQIPRIIGSLLYISNLSHITLDLCHCSIGSFSQSGHFFVFPIFLNYKICLEHHE